MRIPALCSALAVAALAGCASTQSPDDIDASSLGPSDGRVRWSGRLNPTTQRTGALTQADQARAFGNVTLITSASDANRTDVRITVSVPASASNSLLGWAVLPGRCGSGDMPLTSMDVFPPVEVGGNARGELAVTIPLTLPATGTYHVNVYWPGGNQLADVMTCGNLRRG